MEWALWLVRTSPSVLLLFSYPERLPPFVVSTLRVLVGQENLLGVDAFTQSEDGANNSWLIMPTNLWLDRMKRKSNPCCRMTGNTGRLFKARAEVCKSQGWRLATCKVKGL
ncbi:uncharacterized protein B0T23DRAFT_376417, partial [Neurospora hispaniola]